MNKWMLKYLATHPESRVYAVDTWEGSPEYVGTDFHEVEEKFRQRVKETGRENQLVTLKMKSEDGLHHLLDSIGKESIHFAYIDASHEARDVLSDAILVWKLMKENGIVIFDDYRWDDLEQEYFRPRLAIDSFIRSYAPELRVIHIDRQAFVLKLDRSKWITPTLNYKDWSVVMKKVNTLSDAIFKLPELDEYILNNSSRSSRSTRRSSRTIKELTFTTTPSFSKEDEIELEINKLIPKNLVICFKLLMPYRYSDIINKSDKKHHTLSFTYLKPDTVKYGRLYYSHIQSKLTMSLGELSSIQRLLDFHDNTFNANKELVTPNIKTYDHLVILSSNIADNSSFLKKELLKSLETQSYLSLKPNTYDHIGFGALMTEGGFKYKDYQALNYHGRDSASVKWNSLYVLIATHCLKKGGSFDIIFYGTQSTIICEFISYVSNLFSNKPIFYKNLSGSMVNDMVCLFTNFKGITKEQENTLLNWYTSCKPGMYYTSLGVPCKPSIQKMLDNVKQYYKKTLPKVYQVAKQYKELLDKLPPIKQNTIQEYVTGLRVNNYFTTIAKYIKEIPL